MKWPAQIALLQTVVLVSACGGETVEPTSQPSTSTTLTAGRATSARPGDEPVSVALPAGWYSADPDDGAVVDPVTRLVVSSAAIRPEASDCQIDGYHAADDAVVLIVVEWEEDNLALPKRPARFTSSELPVRPPPAIECFEGPGGSAQFTEAGRTLAAYLLVGEQASAELIDQARGVLDTLAVEPSEHLSRDGVAIAVPEAWDARLLFRDHAGSLPVIYQIANFELPENEGFEPPDELPPGQEDPIKAMGPGDVLITVDADEDVGAPASRPIALADLTPVEGARVPRSHELAAGSFCARERCVRIEVDLGGAAPKHLVRQVNEVLASLTIEARS